MKFICVQNKEKMHEGIPLTDEDRAPWLQKIQSEIAHWLDEGRTGVVACSALKRKYRGIQVFWYPLYSVCNRMLEI